MAKTIVVDHQHGMSRHDIKFMQRNTHCICIEPAELTIPEP